MNTVKLANIMKALSNPNRLELYREIAKKNQASLRTGGECFVTDIINSFDVGVPTISPHLKELTKAGLISTERRGKYLVPGGDREYEGHRRSERGPGIPASENVIFLTCQFDDCRTIAKKRGGYMKSSVKKGSALITGATSGIGLELSKLFAHDGYELVLVARDRERLEKTAAGIRQRSGGNVIALTGDLALPGTPAGLYAELEQRSIAIRAKMVLQ